MKKIFSFITITFIFTLISHETTARAGQLTFKKELTREITKQDLIFMDGHSGPPQSAPEAFVYSDRTELNEKLWYVVPKFPVRDPAIILPKGVTIDDYHHRFPRRFEVRFRQNDSTRPKTIENATIESRLRVPRPGYDIADFAVMTEKSIHYFWAITPEIKDKKIHYEVLAGPPSFSPTIELAEREYVEKINYWEVVGDERLAEFEFETNKRKLFAMFYNTTTVTAEEKGRIWIQPASGEHDRYNTTTAIKPVVLAELGNSNNFAKFHLEMHHEFFFVAKKNEVFVYRKKDLFKKPHTSKSALVGQIQVAGDETIKDIRLVKRPRRPGPTIQKYWLEVMTEKVVHRYSWNKKGL